VIGGLTVNAPRAAAPRDNRLSDLFRAESARAVRLAYLLTGERQLAEDLTQEAFVRIAGRLRSVDPDSFSAYFRRTLINLVRSHYRHAQVRRRYADRIDLVQPDRGPEPGTVRHDCGRLRHPSGRVGAAALMASTRVAPV
jgi:DNA-directed RNA polymerase specialized sigma24 family protein